MDDAAPLSGRRVLVPRPPHQASALSARIRAAGGEPVEAATIDTVPGDVDGLADAVADLLDGRFVGLCLTSANGVVGLADAFAAASVEPGPALSALAFVGAVGPRTADIAAERLGVRPDRVPERATGADLAGAVPPGHGEVLLPRGDLAAADLGRGLLMAGYTPVGVIAYRTVAADHLPDAVVAGLTDGSIDLVAFTSASTVRALASLLDGRRWRAGSVTIGPITSAACRELGVPIAAEATPHDLDGLLDALVAVARRERGGGPPPRESRRPGGPSGPRRH